MSSSKSDIKDGKDTKNATTTCDISSSSLNGLPSASLDGEGIKDGECLDDSFPRADLKERTSKVRFDPQKVGKGEDDRWLNSLLCTSVFETVFSPLAPKF